MGIRFRKSVKLGCFKINLSKSGVGYSFGFKGFRVTQTARNTTRTTFSIPGTGISYVTEQSNKKNVNIQKNTQNIPIQENKNTCNEKELNNEITRYSTSEGLEKIKSKVQSALIKDRFADLGIKFFAIASLFLCIQFFPIIIGLIFFILYRIYIRSTQLLKLDYEISADLKDDLADKYKYLIKAALSDQVWRITKTADVINSKYEGGAEQSLYLSPAVVTCRAPYPFVSDSVVACFKSQNDIFVFMPDVLFVISGTKLGVFKYSDVDLSYEHSRFINEGRIPRDAKVIGTTWQYVNNDGSMDKRFNNNREIPVCRFSNLKISSPLGLNAYFMFSRE